MINGWLNDPDFLDNQGNPIALTIEGGEKTFAALAKNYSGDIPTQAMLTTLLSAGSVEKLDDRVRLIRHAYVPSDDPVDKLRILGTDVNELITTIDHNLTVTNSNELRFQRKVSNEAIRGDALPAFRRMSANKAQILLEDLDHWLSEHEVGEDSKGAGGERKYVALGIYYFENDFSEEDKS